MAASPRSARRVCEGRASDSIAAGSSSTGVSVSGSGGRLRGFVLLAIGVLCYGWRRALALDLPPERECPLHLARHRPEVGEEGAHPPRVHSLAAHLRSPPLTRRARLLQARSRDVELSEPAAFPPEPVE